MNTPLEAKKVSESAVEMRSLVMPNDTNPQNTIFGGVVMSWIDMAAAMVAERHSNRPVVTVHVDDMSFKAPIKIGDHVLIKASINYVGKTSMLVGVKVIAENPFTGISRHTTTAYLSFVALDDIGRPIQIRGLILETEAEKRRFQEGKNRVEAMKKNNLKK
ncbi:MAG: acyl-CoA thioesterase [Bacteriovoracaceae bacterium]|nr:acyl-CoA thioesterase [Bacteriovoracaceae bacterium]